MNIKLTGLLGILMLAAGCSATKDLAQSMGTTGTGAIVGTVVGAGAGIGCSKAGGNSALCTAAGVAAGSAAGYAATEIDEMWSAQIPVVDCKGVTKKLGFNAGKDKVKVAAKINLDNEDGVYKIGESIKPKLFYQLAAQENKEIGLKLVDKVKGNQSGILKRTCGGYDAQLDPIDANKEQKINLNYEIVDEKGKTLAKATACVSVSNSGKNLCGKK